ncbi:MAG TPA: PAS domain S-box protein, partial [Candidatus Acidoferrum sp.]|nr:PAS domain S-box protein [Candidatus Acidoferrum sp.]
MSDIGEDQLLVTESQRAEEAARESENRFRLLADTAPVLIWQSGLDKLCTYFNKPWLDFTGRSLEQELGNGWAEGVHPDDFRRCLDTYTQSFDRREEFKMEYRLRHHDGEYRWVFDIGVPRSNRDGAFEGYMGSVVDITERRLAEDRERHVWETLDLVTKQMAAAVTRCSRDFRYLWANQAYADWLQRPLNEVVGHSILEVFGNNAFEELLPHFNRVLTGEKVHYEQETTFRGIGKRWISATYSPTLDANGVANGWVAVVLDITERKRAEEARFRHAAIVESSEDAIISKNLDAIIVSWNAGAERIFGYTESEAVGQPITILVPPELRDEENTILEKLRAGGRIEHYETTRVTKAGRKIDVSLIISPIKDSNAKLVGFCKLAHDITERKRAERALRETNDTLETQTGVLRSQEELLKIFVKNVPAGVAMFDPEMRYLEVSDRWCTDYGVDAAQVLGRSHYELFPDVPDRWKQVHRRALEGYTLQAEEDRWDRQGGFATWVRWEVRPWKTPSGSVGGILIFAEDITHRKQMEEALSGMSRKLIESQEQERARIGRELHDDINQRLAMLAVELEQLQDNPSEASNRVQELRKEITEISNDVQALSHELHSSKLEYLGVVEGIKSWCKEFSERQRMEIDFKNEVSST